jgi:hypothetical protein
MRRPLSKRKCKHCQTFFDPHPRSAGRQRYCSKPKCHQASKAASQRRWLHKPANRDYFTGPTQVERVRQWRNANPGYWRPQGARAPQALQDALTPPETQKQHLDDGLTPHAFQDTFFMQPTVLVGLIAHLTGLSLQDDIATTARRLQQLGRDILYGSPHLTGGIQDAQTPSLIGQTPHRPPPVQLGGSAPGPGALYRSTQS